MRRFCSILAAGIAMALHRLWHNRRQRPDLTRCSRRPRSAAWAASTTSMRMTPDAGCTFRAAPCRATTPPPARVTVFNLDTLAPVGEIPNTRANGAAVDAKSGHGFASSKPVAMWDTKTLALIKTIDIDAKSSPDGILADPFNQRIYVFSHPTTDATVIDAKDGTVLGTIDLGGAPEQAVSDGKGHVYVVIQDKANVAVVDAKTMKVTAHYDFGDKGSRCNGLALDVKNHVLFAACGQSGIPPVTPAQPMMVILNADDGKIITSLPLAGGSDGAVSIRRRWKRSARTATAP